MHQIMVATKESKYRRERGRVGQPQPSYFKMFVDGKVECKGAPMMYCIQPQPAQFDMFVDRDGGDC